MKEKFVHIKNGVAHIYKDKAMTILHCEDGPAIDGIFQEDYYLDGIRYSKESYEKEMERRKKELELSDREQHIISAALYLKDVYIIHGCIPVQNIQNHPFDLKFEVMEKIAKHVIESFYKSENK